MKPTAWKFCEDNDGVIYNVQFDEVPWKLRKSLLEAMKDWTQASVGWYTDNSNQLFSFRKTFKSQQDWENWADKFPLPITEKRYWGDKEKVVIHGKKRK